MLINSTLIRYIGDNLVLDGIDSRHVRISSIRNRAVADNQDDILIGVVAEYPIRPEQGRYQGQSEFTVAVSFSIEVIDNQDSADERIDWVSDRLTTLLESVNSIDIREGIVENNTVREDMDSDPVARITEIEITDSATLVSDTEDSLIRNFTGQIRIIGLTK